MGRRQPAVPPPRVVRHVARLGVVACLGLVAYGVLAPHGRAIGTFKYNVGDRVLRLTPFVDIHGLSGDAVTALGDHTVNLVMLASFTFLAVFAWPAVPPWLWGVAATVLGAASETLQWALPELGRRPLVSNAVENAVGGWLGVGLALLVARLARWRPAWRAHTATTRTTPSPHPRETP